MSGITVKKHWKKDKVFLMRMKQIFVKMEINEKHSLPAGRGASW